MVRRRDASPSWPKVGRSTGRWRTVPLAPQRRLGRRSLAPVGTQRLGASHGTAHAHRCEPPRRDPGGRRRWNTTGRIRFRNRDPQAPQGQHLSRQGHPHRTVAAGGVRGIWRQPPRLPGLLGNPSRLLSDPGRRPRTADRRAAAPGGRSRRRPSRGGATGSTAPTSRTCASENRAEKVRSSRPAASRPPKLRPRRIGQRRGCAGRDVRRGRPIRRPPPNCACRPPDHRRAVEPQAQPAEIASERIEGPVARPIAEAPSRSAIATPPRTPRRRLPVEQPADRLCRSRGRDSGRGAGGRRQRSRPRTWPRRRSPK